MKKILVLALAALFAVSGAASAGLLNSEEPGEVSVSGYYLFPGDSGRGRGCSGCSRSITGDCVT